MPILSKHSKKFQVLLKTVYAEARGQPVECQKAIAWTVANRVRQNRPEWGGSDTEDVCKKRHQYPSWTDKIDIEMPDEETRRSIESWLRFVFNEPDPTGGATHYYDPQKKLPLWLGKHVFLKKIGKYRFYRAK